MAISICFQCHSVQSNDADDPLEKNLKLAGENRPELEKVLAHYRAHPADSLKLQAAMLLLSNMERSYHYTGKWLNQYNSMVFNKTAHLSESAMEALTDSVAAVLGTPDLTQQHDLATLSADYLIQNMDQAFTAWQEAPWAQTVSFETFCNYILPYHNFAEQPEVWRDTLRLRYEAIKNQLPKTATMADITCQINEDLMHWFHYTDFLNAYPGRISIHHLLQGQRGNCSDMANIATYCTRALGIPVAIDYTPQWGNYHDGHVWNALILNDHESLPFLGAEANPGEYTGLPESEHQFAKVFRRTLTVQATSVAVRAAKAGERDLPIYLQNPRIQDVTNLYTPTYTVKIPIPNRKRPFVYLCIAKQSRWEAIEGSQIDAQGFATFNKMGNNILYNPMFFYNGRYEPAGMPFIITYEGTLQMLPADQTNAQKVWLTRIFPFKRSDAKWKYAEYYRDARLEGANKPDFSDAKTLLTIIKPMDKWHIGQLGGPSLRDKLEYESLWEAAAIKDKTAYRYVRLIFPEKQFCKVGELQLFDQNSTLLQGKAIGSVQHPEWAFDGVPGYSIIDESPAGGRWVGLDLGTAKPLSQLRYLPATGEYDIQPGKTYQLFYWNNHWQAIGIQTATKHALEFDNVPTHALLWLHCKDCDGTFERPFTYENGKQIWW